jgi:hypothetical protein
MLRRPLASNLSSRPGLAPLELTLSLPILLVLMALMINFGVIGSWKVRTQGNAHYEAFRTLLVRTGDANPPADNWPNAAQSSGSGYSLPTVAQLWDSDINTARPRANWARGPWLTAPNQAVPVQVKGRLEFDTGVHAGTAGMRRQVPLLRGAVTNGEFGFKLTQEMLDNRWQFHTMGIGDNRSSRARAWWAIEHNDLAALDGQIATSKSRLDAAQQRLFSNPHPEFLYPLDQDIEFRIYTGNAPNFYPQLPGGCSLDVTDMQKNHVDPLVRNITNLPCSMSGSFLGLYSNWICRLQRCGADAQTIAPLRERFDDLAQLVRSVGCGSNPQFPDCQPCDPADAQCLSQCPAPTPDADGL